MPMQAAIATAGAPSRCSTSIELIHSPPDLITSLLCRCSARYHRIDGVRHRSRKQPSVGDIAASPLIVSCTIHDPHQQGRSDTLPSRASSPPFGSTDLSCQRRNTARPCWSRMLRWLASGFQMLPRLERARYQSGSFRRAPGVVDGDAVLLAGRRRGIAGGQA